MHYIIGGDTYDFMDKTKVTNTGKMFVEGRSFPTPTIAPQP